MKTFSIGIMSFLVGSIIFLCSSCNEKPQASNKSKPEQKHHLNIPAGGIQSMMEANSQKVIEGTDGSVMIVMGEVNRKKADIAVKRDDKIVDEQIVEEGGHLVFDYNGTQYTIELKNAKKPLIGIGKAEITIK